MPQDNKLKSLLDLSYRYQFNEETDDALANLPEVQRITNSSRGAVQTPEQARRNKMRLRLAKLEGFLERARLVIDTRPTDGSPSLIPRQLRLGSTALGGIAQ